jgi:hypothetical protein
MSAIIAIAEWSALAFSALFFLVQVIAREPADPEHHSPLASLSVCVSYWRCTSGGSGTFCPTREGEASVASSS